VIQPRRMPAVRWGRPRLPGDGSTVSPFRLAQAELKFSVSERRSREAMTVLFCRRPEVYNKARVARRDGEVAPSLTAAEVCAASLPLSRRTL
jgi:hypothetical protein